MRVFTRLALLMVFSVLLPALPAAWMARQLVTRSLNLGLNPQIDAALKSGVRQAREQYERQGRDLADSVAAFPPAGQIVAAVAQAGLADGRCAPLHGGIVTLFTARREGR